MKTITEFRPLIYAELLEEAEKRRVRRCWRQRTTEIGLPLFYIAAAMKIVSDTGLKPWDWRFYVIFVPLYLLGEKLRVTLRRG